MEGGPGIFPLTRRNILIAYLYTLTSPPACAHLVQLLTLKDVGGLLTTNETIGIANLPDQVHSPTLYRPSPPLA